MSSIKDPGHRICERTDEVKSIAYLLQQLSVVVQRITLFPFWDPLVVSVYILSLLLL